MLSADAVSVEALIDSYEPSDAQGIARACRNSGEFRYECVVGTIPGS
jgi:hypothetical protein